MRRTPFVSDFALMAAVLASMSPLPALTLPLAAPAGPSLPHRGRGKGARPRLRRNPVTHGRRVRRAHRRDRRAG